MTRTFEARISGRLVRTFSDLQLAERYAERMEREGASVEIKRVRIERRAA